MTDEQVQKIWDEAVKKVSVSCDEYHGHAAVDGCLEGSTNKDAIDICKLAETLLSERKMMRAVVDMFDVPARNTLR